MKIRKEVYTRGTFAAKEFMRLCKSLNQSSEYITGKKAKKIRQALRIYDATQQEFDQIKFKE